MVGVKEKSVPPEDLWDHGFRLGETRGPSGGEGRVGERGPTLRRELWLQGVDIVQREGGLGVKDALFVQPQALAEAEQGSRCQFPLIFQPHRRQPGPFLQYPLHVLAKIVLCLTVLVLWRNIGIPGDGDHRPGPHGVAVEELVGEGEHHLFGQYVAQAPFFQLQKRGQRPGNGHQAQILFSVPFEGQSHIELFGGQVGKWVVGVHYQGGENGGDTVPEKALHLTALPAIQLTPLQIADVAGPQPLLQGKKQFVPAAVERRYGLKDGGELLGGGEPALVVHMGLFDEGHVPDAPHPDHEELIQIAGEDGGKLKPLEEGDCLVPGFFHHPLIEFEPGELPLLGVTSVYLIPPGHRGPPFP